MSSESIKRIERLVTFRERERDAAGAEVGAAQAERDAKSEEVERATEALAREQSAAIHQPGSSIRAEDLGLSVGCVEAARDELAEKNETLASAEEKVNEKTRELLEAHRRVRKFEVLLDVWKRRRHSSQAKKEQLEMDDLALSREARR